MMKCNKEFALKTAIDLAKTNIESTEKWVEPEYVIDFMEEVYSFLTDERKSDDE